MGRFFVVGLLALGSPGGATAAPAKGTTLTEAIAVELALENPALADAIQGRLAAADAAVLEASLWPNPRLQYNREQSLARGFAAEDEIRVMQPFEPSGRRGLRRKAARTRTEAARAWVEVDRAEVVAQVRHAYADATRAQQLLDLLLRWRADLEQSVAATRARLERGDAARLDVQRVEIEVRYIDLRVTRARGNVLDAWVRLRPLLGNDTDATVPRFVPRAPTARAPRKHEVASAPALRAVEAELTAAQQDRRAAGRAWVPRVTLGFGYRSVDPGSGSRQHGIVAAAQLPIPLGTRGQDQRRAADARVAQTRGDATRRRQQLIARHDGLTARLEALRPGVEAKIDPALVELATRAYRGGEIAVVQLLDAYRGSFTAEITRLQLELELWRTQIELDRAHGRTMP